MLTVSGQAVRIHRQQRRSLLLKRTPLGPVAFIPLRYAATHPDVIAFIEQSLHRIGPFVERQPVHTQASLRQLAAAWAAALDVRPTRIQFREMYRKWGSCSSKGTVTYSTALLYVPEPLASYIVLHELAHLLELNHSRAFWAIIARHMPDYRERELALRGFE
jgi:hypothetical protein